MKKLILTILTASLLASCAKEDLYQEVQFSYTFVEEGSMTKTIDHSSVKTLISGALPTNISPYLYFNKDDSTSPIEVKIGTKTTMKVGTYLAKWKNTPTMVENVMIDQVYWSKTPLLNIYSDIKIVGGVSEYSIPVSFKSFAIVADTTEVKWVEFLTLGQAWKKIDFFLESGNILLAFVDGELVDDTVLGIRLVPKDASRKETRMYFSPNLTTYDNRATVRPTYGKYYTIHPDEVTEMGSIFSLNIPEWTCGDE